VIASLVTFCEALRVYVPVAPVPVTNAVIVVPAVTPVPEIVWPICSDPTLFTAVTVRVVPEIDPVKETFTVWDASAAAHAALLSTIPFGVPP
jgi:hypothetical protein